MADFKKMYYSLLGEVSNVIDILQKALQKAEQLYIASSADTMLTLVPENDRQEEDDE